MNTYKKKLSPTHPGEILKEELLIPHGISQSQLAKDLKISFRRVNEICQSKRPITLDTAVRLSIYFGTSVELWLDLQRDYELECLEDEKEIQKLQRIIHPYSGTRVRGGLFLKK